MSSPPDIALKSPTEAVALVRDAVETFPGAWEYLDQYLQHGLFQYLGNAEGDPEILAQGLMQAEEWAFRSDQASWRSRWDGYLDLLEEARERTSKARALNALLMPRAADILRLLGSQDEPFKPAEIADRLALTKAQAFDLLDGLESGGLVQIQQAGVNVWVMLTVQGHQSLNVL